MNPKASAGFVTERPRESTPPTALGSFLKSSKHFVKLVAATREEKNKRSRRIRMHVGGMVSAGGKETRARATKLKPLLVFLWVCGLERACNCQSVFADCRRIKSKARARLCDGMVRCRGTLSEMLIQLRAKGDTGSQCERKRGYLGGDGMSSAASGVNVGRGKVRGGNSAGG